MNLKEAQILSKCHRPGPAEAALQDPQVQKAAKLVAADPALKEGLAAQVEFDNRQALALDSLKPGEDFLDKIDGALENLQQKGWQWSALRHPAFLAGAIAVLVMIGVLIYAWQGMEENFPGKDALDKMVETIDHQTAKGMNEKSALAGDLGDWFFDKGYEDFRILPQFAAMKTTGCRFFKEEGYPVAQIALENHNALLNIFHATDFNVHLDPPDRWRLSQEGDWAVATRADDTTGYMVMFKGRKADMQDFIDALK